MEPVFVQQRGFHHSVSHSPREKLEDGLVRVYTRRQNNHLRTCLMEGSRQKLRTGHVNWWMTLAWATRERGLF